MIDLFVPSAPLTPTDLIFHWILGDVSTKYSYLLEELSGDFSSLSSSVEFTGIFFLSGSGHYKQFLPHFWQILTSIKILPFILCLLHRVYSCVYKSW